MKNYIYKTFIIIVCISCIAACKPNLDTPTPDKGSLDLTRYVSVGNSITSGYADNALYYQGQLVSYPNLIAQQFKLAGGGDFKQPLVSASSVGVGNGDNNSLVARLALSPVADCKGVVSLSPKSVAASGDASIFATNIYASQGPFNNVGVPGAKAITTVFPGYGNPANGLGKYNPFFTRFASNPSTASMLSDAAAVNPTFFSLFIGNNDVLGYALSGGTKDSITPSSGTPGHGFDASIDLIVSTLTAQGAKGVIANIPDITSLPYFTTVPYNGLVLDQASATALKQGYAAKGVPAAYIPDFQPGPNPFIISDPSSPVGFRPLHAGELVLLNVSQDSIKCNNLGSAIPFNSKYVLTANEISQISAAVSAYNNKLKAVAAAKGLAYVDVNAFLKMANAGIEYNGIQLTTKFASGGAISLDGIHLTPIGNALLANQFILAINATYSVAIPLIDATKYSGVVFP